MEQREFRPTVIRAALWATPDSAARRRRIETPVRGPWTGKQRAAVDAAFLELEARSDSIRRNRMKPAILGLVPSYGEPSVGDEVSVGSVQRALAIVRACVWERRLPELLESDEIRQIGQIAAELDISQADLQSVRVICGFIGFDELEGLLTRSSAGRSTEPELRRWFHTVIGRVGELMEEGFDRPRIVGFLRPAAADPATTLRGEVASWLKENQSSVTWRTAHEVLGAGIFRGFQSRPGFAHETRRWLDASISLFALALEQGRSATVSEMEMVCSHALTGIHAEIPVERTQAGVAFAADKILQSVTNDLLRDIPTLPTSGIMGEIVARVVAFREQLIQGIQQRGPRTRLGTAVWFDRSRNRLVADDGRSVDIARAEGIVLSQLIDGADRFPLGAFEMSEALSVTLGRVVSEHAVHHFVSRLRGRLRPFGLGASITSARGKGYRWNAPIARDPDVI